MKKFILIGLGGFFGAIARYAVKAAQLSDQTGDFPFDTLGINIAGSFLLGLIMTLALEIWEIDSGIRLGITTGLLGAFTTFSALCMEALRLIKDGCYISAGVYMGLSVLLGLTAAYLGVAAARKFIADHEDAEERQIEEGGSGS